MKRLIFGSWLDLIEVVVGRLGRATEDNIGEGERFGGCILDDFISYLSGVIDRAKELGLDIPQFLFSGAVVLVYGISISERCFLSQV